jgi:cytoskeletal protein RodZ
MSEQKPEAVWIFPDPPKKRGARTALVVLLVVLALIAAGVVVLFLLPRAGGPTTSPTASASSSPSASPTATPTNSTAAPTVAPTTAPTTAPPVPDPSLDGFREAVGFRLSTADEGLNMVAQGGSDTAATIQKLQGDAQRLLDTPPPSSIATKWRDTLQAYAAYLDSLSGNPSDSGALSGARSSVATMKSLIGM